MNNLAGEELLTAWESERGRAGFTHEKHAAELGIPIEIYKARFYRAMENRRFAKIIEREMDRPELFAADQYQALEFQFDSFIAICDIHAPCTNYDLAMLPALVAKKHLKRGNRNLVVHGDIFDGSSASHWEKIVREPTWEQERAAAANLFAHWAQVFDQIVIMPGNHDYRMLKRLEGEQTWGSHVWGMVNEQDRQLAHMFGSLFSTGKLITSPVDHCFVNTPQGRYIIAHGSEYSRNPLAVANEMAQNYQAHVILGHEHHLGLSLDRYGRYFIVNNGGLFDVNKFAYVALQASKKPHMENGFTLVQGGYPTVFGRWTNWSAWL